MPAMSEAGSPPEAGASPSPYRWRVLAAATLAQAGTCFLVQGLGALAAFMQDALHLSAFQIGLLVSAAQLVPIVGLLVAGELLDRFGERLIVGLGALVVAAALASASLASTFEGLLFWLVILGAAYSSAQPGGSKAVSRWFARQQRGFAMGIRQAGLPLGGALAAAILPAVAAAHGWQGAFLVGAAVAAAAGVLFIAVYRSPPDMSADEAVGMPTAGASPMPASGLAGRLSLLREPGMRNIMLSGPILIAVQYAILIYFVLHLRDRFEMPVAIGAALLVVAQLSGVVGRIALAAWSDRCAAGRYFPVMVSMWALVAGLIVLMIVPFASLALFAVLAAWLGFFGFGWFGPWITYVSEAAPPERVGIAIGMALTVNQIVIIASPPLLGLGRDLTGSYTADWIVLAALLLAALAATRRRKASPV
jgi:sugar phosphate permease